MSLNQLGLGFVFEAKDMASGVMHKVEETMEGLSEASGVHMHHMDEHIEKLGAGLGALAVGLEGLHEMYEKAEASAKFEQSLVNTGARAGASAEEMHQLQEAATDTAREMKSFSSMQAMEGLYGLADAGYKTKDAISLLTPALLLAEDSMGAISPSAAGGIAAGTMRAFGIETKDAAAMVNQMVVATQQFSNTRLPELAQGLTTIGPAAQRMNQSMTETSIGLGLIQNKMANSGRALMAWRMTLTRLADPKIAKELAAQHVAVTDANGYRPVMDIMSDLAARTKAMSESGRQGLIGKMFGSRNGDAVNAILSQLNEGVKNTDGTMRKGAEAIAYYREQLIKTEEPAENLAKRIGATFEKAEERLHNASDDMAIAIGTPFRKVFTPLIDASEEGVRHLTAAIGKISPDAQSFFAKLIVGGLAAIAFAGAALLVAEAGPFVTAGLAMMGTALWDLVVAAGVLSIELWPVTLALAAIVLIGYGLSKMTGGLEAAWDGLVEGFENSGAFNEVKEAWDNLKTSLVKLGAEFGFSGDKINVVKGIFKVLGWTVGFVVRIFLGFATLAIDIVAGVVLMGKWIVWLIKKFEFLGDAAKAAWGWVKKVTGIGGGGRATIAPPVAHAKDAPAGHPELPKGAEKGKPLGRKPMALTTEAAARSRLEFWQDRDSQNMIDRAAAQDASGKALDYKKWAANEPARAAAATAAAGLAEHSSLAASEGPIDYAKMAEVFAKSPIQVTLTVGQEKLATVIAKGAAAQQARESNTNTYINR